MVWSSRIDNAVFLKNLYGGLPSLHKLKVEKIAFSWEGPSCLIDFITAEQPRYFPKNYNKEKLVLIQIGAYGMKRIKFERLMQNGESSILMYDVKEGTYIRITQSTHLTALADYVRITKVSPISADAKS